MIITRTFKNNIDPSIYSARLAAAKYNLWRDALKMNRHIDGFLQINQIDSETFQDEHSSMNEIQISSNTYEMEEKAYNVFTFTPIKNIYLKYRTFKG